jgi:ABC-type transporter Mla maintaining outer membrane lipid asymmetry ATPase subunit MlaF
VTAPLLQLAAVSKSYGGLRPLRIAGLSVASGERVAILGTDAAAAETFVNLVTGASLPEEGEVRVFGRATRDIPDASAWLAVVDRLGLVSGRAVLLEALSPVQNLAVPFSLDIEPPSDEVRRRSLALAEEVGLSGASLNRPVAELEPAVQARLRLGRALALDPTVLIVEHVTAGLPRPDIVPLAELIAAVARGRRMAILALTADHEFADAVAARVFTLDARTGRLAERRRRPRFWPSSTKRSRS